MTNHKIRIALEWLDEDIQLEAARKKLKVNSRMDALRVIAYALRTARGEKIIRTNSEV